MWNEVSKLQFLIEYLTGISIFCPFLSKISYLRKDAPPNPSFVSPSDTLSVDISSSSSKFFVADLDSCFLDLLEEFYSLILA